jgi:hypothetical protein
MKEMKTNKRLGIVGEKLLILIFSSAVILQTFSVI